MLLYYRPWMRNVYTLQHSFRSPRLEPTSQRNNAELAFILKGGVVVLTNTRSLAEVGQKLVRMGWVFQTILGNVLLLTWRSSLLHIARRGVSRPTRPPEQRAYGYTPQMLLRCHKSSSPQEKITQKTKTASSVAASVCILRSCSWCLLILLLRCEQR